MNRLSQGLSPVEFLTTYGRFEMEIGETVSFNTDNFVQLGQDGLTSSDVFVLTRKEITENGILWRADPVGTYRSIPGVSPEPTTPVVPVVYANDHCLGLRGPAAGAAAVEILTDLNTFNGKTNVYWSFWVKRTTAASAVDSVVLSRWDDSQEQFRIVLNQQNIKIDLNGASYSAVTRTDPIRPGFWHWVGIAFEGGSALRVVTGSREPNRFQQTGLSLKTEDFIESGILPTTLDAVTSNTRIGADSAAPLGIGTEWTGLIDEIAMWHTDTPYPVWFTKAQELYARGIPERIEPEPHHYYRFERDFTDSVAGLNGAPIGAPFFSTDTPR